MVFNHSFRQKRMGNLKYIPDIHNEDPVTEGIHEDRYRSSVYYLDYYRMLVTVTGGWLARTNRLYGQNKDIRGIQHTTRNYCIHNKYRAGFSISYVRYTQQ